MGRFDGVHKGFAALGNAVASFGNRVASLIGFFFHVAGEDHGFGVNRWLGYVAVSFVIKFVLAVLGFLLHIAFYVALLFKLFFLAATPVDRLWLVLFTFKVHAPKAESRQLITDPFRNISTGVRLRF